MVVVAKRNAAAEVGRVLNKKETVNAVATNKANSFLRPDSRKDAYLIVMVNKKKTLVSNLHRSFCRLWAPWSKAFCLLSVSLWQLLPRRDRVSVAKTTRCKDLLSELIEV